MTSTSSSVSAAGDVRGVVHGVVVKRFGGKLGSRDQPDPRFQYLSRLRYDEGGWSCDDEILLFTNILDGSSIHSCGGLVYRDVEGKQMVICNPKTKEFKTLPSLQPPPGTTMTLNDAIGFGFDSESNDFKVVRCVSHQMEELIEDGPFGRPMLVYSGVAERRVELYSLKSDSWKVIPYPDTFMSSSFVRHEGAYVGGKCYWLAVCDHSSSRELSFDYKFIIQSFDFAAESPCAPIDLPPLPTTRNRQNTRYHYRVVEYVGSLGVVRYALEGRRGKSKSFSLFLWKEEQQKWRRVFRIDLPSVRKPLGFSKDGRHLFLEEEDEYEYSSNAEEEGLPLFSAIDHQLSLFVYDIFNRELQKLDIEDAGGLEIVSYVESNWAPGAGVHPPPPPPPEMCP